MGAELFHADGRTGGTDRQTHMTKLLVAFRNFANAPNSPSILGSSLELKYPTIVERLISRYV